MGQPLNGTAGPPMGLQMCASAMPPPPLSSHFCGTAAKRGGQTWRSEGGRAVFLYSFLTPCILKQANISGGEAKTCR